uniref:Acyl-CoA dehydrogenase n=1 Tax=candidate division WOR-3 bacterium TaxID=2052148 RepID=A0A7C6EJC8_UNCW3
MELNKEALLLQNEIRKFAKEVLSEKADEFDKKGIFPVENIKKISEMGILGSTIPESFGGCALDTVSFLVTLEEISKVCPSTALILLAHNILFSYPLVKFGNDAQKKKYLPFLAAGESIGGFAEVITNEIKVGLENNSYIISGRNHILLNGVANGPFLMFAEYNGKVDALMVDSSVSGVLRNKKDNIIGMNCSGITELVFDNLRVSADNRLGNEGDGRNILEEIKTFANLGFSAINLGIAQASMENAIKYAKERVQFGEPIINFGMVREMIADMATKIEAVRNLLYDGANIRDNNKDCARISAITRYFSNQAVAEITTNAIQVYGGYGYMKDYPVERYFRDAQVSRVLCCSGMELKESIVSKTI